MKVWKRTISSVIQKPNTVWNFFQRLFNRNRFSNIGKKEIQLLRLMAWIIANCDYLSCEWSETDRWIDSRTENGRKCHEPLNI